MMQAPLRALVYARVSTDAQERDGTSLDTQERACLEYAEAAGWRVVECIRDAASGFSLDRTGIERVRQLLRQGAADIVVAYAVDRLSRNQNHIGVLFSEVEQAGARLECVTEKFEDSAMGRFILAARAFMAEVEREKITERTMRGKAERARSGRIPQGTGKGIYGYSYNRETGHREIDAYQAAVVQRIFERYADTQSYSAVSNELNGAGVPSMSGGRWYPLTIRRVLSNETYTGRFFYRRTKRVKGRRNGAGPAKYTVEKRPEADWILVSGSTPRIISDTLWQRVQEVLHDPDRAKRRPTPRYYPLRGRTRCGVCGSAMVGQTLTVKGHAYRYYRCRHAYDKNTGHSCTAKYVPGHALESAVWDEVKRVLSDPAVVLRELQRAATQDDDDDGIRHIEKDIKALEEREKRLVRLYSLGHIGEAAISDEAAGLSAQRQMLEQHVRSMKRPASIDIGELDEATLSRTCSAIRTWVDSATEDDQKLALEALQVHVEATRDSGTLSGYIPLDTSEFINEERSSP